MDFCSQKLCPWAIPLTWISKGIFPEMKRSYLVQKCRFNRKQTHKWFNCFWKETKEIHHREEKKKNDEIRSLATLSFQLPGAHCFLHDSNESIFYFFVSKTVNEWIQHGDDNSIKNRSHLIPSQGVGLTWL